MKLLDNQGRPSNTAASGHGAPMKRFIAKIWNLITCPKLDLSLHQIHRLLAYGGFPGSFATFAMFSRQVTKMIVRNEPGCPGRSACRRHQQATWACCLLPITHSTTAMIGQPGSIVQCPALSLDSFRRRLATRELSFGL
jgi:hypothetical protein